MIALAAAWTNHRTATSNCTDHASRHPAETGIGGLGNKNVTSKRDYRYQRLDGEASISCCWQQVSRWSQVTWSPWLRPGPITRQLFQIILITLLVVGCRCISTTDLCRKFIMGIRLVVWRKFHFFGGIAVSCICIMQTAAFSCCGFHFIYMHAWCVSCNWGKHNATWLCESVTVAFISLWKLKFLAHLLNVTMFRYAYHFKRKCFVLHIYLTTAVGNGRYLPKMLHLWVHGVAQARNRKTFQVSKESRAVCSQNYRTYVTTYSYAIFMICVHVPYNPFLVPNRVHNLPHTDSCVITECSQACLHNVSIIR